MHNILSLSKYIHQSSNSTVRESFFKNSYGCRSHYFFATARTLLLMGGSYFRRRRTPLPLPLYIDTHISILGRRLNCSRIKNLSSYANRRTFLLLRNQRNPSNQFMISTSTNGSPKKNATKFQGLLTFTFQIENDFHSSSVEKYFIFWYYSFKLQNYLFIEELLKTFACIILEGCFVISHKQRSKKESVFAHTSQS